YEKLVNASRAKKLEKSHDPLALVAHTGSSSRNSSPYYVTHPSSVVDYDDDYQEDTFQNNSEDPLISAMMLLARAIVQGDKMLLAKQDEAGVTLTDDQNDFLFVDATRMEEIKELRPSYDSAFLSEEAEKQQINANKVKQQNKVLIQQLELYKEKVRVFEMTRGDNETFFNEFIEADRKAKRLEKDLQTQFIRDRDIIRDLEQQRDRDTKDILDDATKSQIKMKNKFQDPIAIEKKQNVCTIDYKKLNALYEDFVPQKEFSAEQKYFSSSFIFSENSSNASSSPSSSETKPTVAPMPSANPMKLDLNKMENQFKTLFALLQTNSKRESIFYTSPEEIRLTKFCQKEVKPILHKLHLIFEIFQKRFLKDIKEMKDVFDSTKNDLSASWKQNEPLNDQLLEAKLKHEIECCVLLSHECVNNNVQDEIEKIQRDSIEI
ncbi:hypothetical protein Tco_0542486, partial [Tanacetum coccineum]